MAGAECGWSRDKARVGEAKCPLCPRWGFLFETRLREVAGLGPGGDCCSLLGKR